MLTHRNLIANLAQTEGALSIDDGELILAVLPFFHVTGMQNSMNVPVYLGSTAVILPRWKAGICRSLSLPPAPARRRRRSGSCRCR
jgi:acyl-CoA synthetase (AMP-forming)/AMP-acid ligase II